MSSMFTPDQGFFVRTPSWHRLEKHVLDDWPGTWAEAARLSGVADWDPISTPAYHQNEMDSTHQAWGDFVLDENWQRISRSDNGYTLSYQETSYRVIKNTEFGAVIESVLGMDLGEELAYEGVFELDGGRMVVAVLYWKDGLQVPGDPSKTVRYAVFVTRHDGQGGLRCLLTNVRVVCANTLAMAEDGSSEGATGFSIRHTANWDAKVAEVRERMLESRQGAETYLETMATLAAFKVNVRQREHFLRQLLPIGDDMGRQQQVNRDKERMTIRNLLEGPTCEHISDTAYGLLQATTEWSDHYRREPGTADAYVKRQLTTTHDMKGKGLRLVKAMASRG